ncbi:McrB family protein [Algibacter pectinivorans]|uniref:5-methylcytosine-specific restriction enzyme B n=1 Tax=Algibacter pectinivorans TaxID=870482 RepID=A0A1I1R297_9FLAO|nr:AAA family ATPase [Algibacter pectinivorans]SFD28337.1 5-methylcytosine-specific restriction enzyme B [Algibacter pectinivorans]
MIDYKDYEREVYNWLSNKNKQDSNFTFSLRQKASKGSELDYFIGTEKSKYFAVTFWSIPVTFPGSSGDFIGLVFKLSKDYVRYGYDFKFTQTNNPGDRQNKSVLNVLKALVEPIRENIGVIRESDALNKMFTIRTKPKKVNYTNLDDMLVDVEDDLLKIIPIVNGQIEGEKRVNPEFEAHRISKEVFADMRAKLLARFEKFGEQSDLNKESVGVSNTRKTINRSLKPINQILYGPPGTGKTYATKEMSVAIIDKDFITGIDKTLSNKDKRKLISDRYTELCNSEQIVFTTFHQSISYEDFVEGIKPVPPVSEESSINYKIEDGIFKNICKKASEIKSSSNFDDAYSKFVNDVVEAGTIELKSLVQKKPFNVRINSNETAVAIPKTEIATEMGITKEMMREYIVNGIIKDWKTYTTAIGEYIKETYKVSVENTDSKAKNYVLIIDEINRGNVSAIFGELITLIEPDKRIGQVEQLLVKLPYSKIDFGVPANLYIIGTMNTADRSVEALDTALRRRFEFKEMMPDYTVIENEFVKDVSMSEVLETINQRIELLIDRDHTIGHSYFVGVDNEEKLANAFNNKIVPLLQEYFYGDYGKIGLVLGKGFVKRKKNENIKFSSFKYEEKNDFITPTFSLKLIDESNSVDAVKQLLETKEK